MQMYTKISIKCFRVNRGMHTGLPSFHADESPVLSQGKQPAGYNRNAGNINHEA